MSLKAFLDISKPSKWLWHNHTTENHISQQALNDKLKKLVKDANVQTIGQVKFHLLRKFLMGALTRSNFSDWQTKRVLAKEIPTTDSTYLQTLNASIDEKWQIKESGAFPEVYERIRLTGFINHNSTRIEQLEAKIRELETVNVTVRKEMLSVFKEMLAELRAKDIISKDTETKLNKTLAKLEPEA